MKQVLLQGGKTVLAEVPAPKPEIGQVLVRVAWSCLSPGTELAMAAATSTAGVVERIGSNPMAFRRALGALRERGLRGFAVMAREKLTKSSVAAGYSCSGLVLEAGAVAEEFRPGERVACAGAGYANHAEVVVIPRNLVVRVPETVDLADAATVALGAIALQGVRRAQVSLGERIGVIGLGFLGQLTIQILKASGCKVYGLDLEAARVAQGKSFGLDAAPDGDDPVDAAKRFSDGYGLDAVLLTATDKSDELLALAMQMARRKGRIVVIGDVGLGARRELMYAKELDLLIATSYGPGRYDPTYEEDGVDYPYAYVRWTENRNMQAYLELIAAGRVKPGPLIARRLPVTESSEAYRLLKEDKPRPYTVLLEYPNNAEAPIARRLALTEPTPTKVGVVKFAILGAGSFARGVHVPNLQRLSDRFRIEAVVARHGPAAIATGRQVGARIAGTDYMEALAEPSVDAVLIATRHHLHAMLVEESLRAGKHVFVEKPMAITEEELQNLIDTVNKLTSSGAGCPTVFVGFNRRYSPYALRLREAIAHRSAPINLSYRMNAGYLPPEHWVHGPEGGGRVLGEACHILDLFRFLTGSSAVEVCATGIRSPRRDVAPTDNFSTTIRYSDGSVCTLLYTAQGGKELPKELLEMHVDGRSFVLDDYKSLTSFGATVQFRTRTQEKGHCEELVAFHDTISGKLDRRPVWAEAVEVTRTALEIDRQVRGR